MKYTTTAALALTLIAGAASAQDATPVVNVNTASVEQLDFLPGIGPAKADNIAYAREQGVVFSSVDDLLVVHGIGPVTVEKLRPYVTTSGETTATGPVGTKTADEGPEKLRRPVE